MKVYDYLEYFVKVIQRIVSIIIPMIMIFTVAICASDGIRNYIFPNPPLSILDEVQSWTFYPTILNYVLIFIYLSVGIGNINSYSRKKQTISVFVAIVYALVNTVLFAYYFYISYFFGPGMWHLFKMC